MPALDWDELDDRRSRRRLAQRHRDRRAVAVLAIASAIAVIVAAVPFAFSGGGGPGDIAPADPLTESPFAGGGPANLIVARAAGIDLRLPLASDRMTAAVLSSSDNPTARRLDPGEGVDVISNAGSDAAGPPSSALSIGAPAGTPVYSPIDGIVASVSPNLVAGRELGFQVTLQPNSQSSAAIRVTNLTAAPGGRPQLGEPVGAGATPLGQVADLSGVAQLSMSRFTADAGNHIRVEVVDSGDSSGA